MKVLRQRTKTLPDLLPTEVMDRIWGAGVTKRFADGQVIQQRGDISSHIYFVKSGMVAAGNFGLDGSFLASALLYPGEHFGDITLFAGVPRTQNLWAQGPTEIAQIGEKEFMALFDSEPTIPRALLTISTLRNYEMVEFLDTQRRLTLQARVSRLLLLVVEPGTRSETVECRHEDFAFMFGVSRVSIGKALKRLQEDGLVTLHYGRIHLPDVERLRKRVESEFQLLPVTQD